MTRFPVIGAGLIAAVSAHAFAHVSLAEPSARAGSYHAAFFRLSHGCEGSPTLSLRIEIPAAITIARPQPKPGWTLAVEKAPLATPIRSEGGQLVATRVAAITWTGRLEADQFDQFGVMLKLPDTPGPLAFPAIQRCERGEVRWTDVPTPGTPRGSVKTPAPVLEVTPGSGPTMDHMRM